MDAFLEGIATDELRILRCAPHPIRWREFSRDFRLAWQAVAFEPRGSGSVPDGPGLYCFVVTCRMPGLPAVMYPLYAGETLSLKDRYRDYIVERNAHDGRVHVRKFLNVFWGEVEFAYAELQADKDGLRAVEQRLNDALMPTYSRRDFSAQVRQRRAAWP